MKEMKRYRYITLFVILFTAITHLSQSGYNKSLITENNHYMPHNVTINGVMPNNTTNTTHNGMTSDDVMPNGISIYDVTIDSITLNNMIFDDPISDDAIPNDEISNDLISDNPTTNNQISDDTTSDNTISDDASNDNTYSSYEDQQQENTYVEISKISDSFPIYDENNIVLQKSFALFSLPGNNNLYGYSKLSEKMQGYYDLIDTAFLIFLSSDYLSKDYPTNEAFITAFGIKQSGVTIKDLMKVYWSYKNDHPEYYWISNYFSYNSSNTEAFIYVLMDNSYAKAADRAAYDALIDEKINYYINTVYQTGYESDYEKIRTVHDMLIESVDYAYNSSGNPETFIWAHNIIGIFSKRGAVCEGYAKTFQLILNKLGIKNVYVIGNAGEAHAWNYVCIDEKYYAVDITWDDLGMTKNSGYGGMMYQYFCMPGNYFKSSHTAYTKSGNPLTGKWLYDLPILENGMENTYYMKYNALAVNINSSNVDDFITKASIYTPGDYIHILSDSASRNYIASALGVSSYIPVSKYGSYTALLIKKSDKILYPATSISLSSTNLLSDKIEINRDELIGEIYLTANMTSTEGACDDKIIWSASDSIIQISGSGNTVKLIPKRNGTVVITAKAVKGVASASCTVVISGSSNAHGIYLDDEYTKSILNDEVTIWVNGGNVKIDNANTKYNYRKALLYTDLTPSNIVTIKNGKTTTKSGKLIVGVTMTEDQPELVRGKIVDTEAAKIAKAAIKNGIITITAQKQSGIVYVWVIDTGNEGKTGYAPVNVKIAPSKIAILNNKDDEIALKQITIPINTEYTFYLQPTIDKNKTITEDATYYVTSTDKVASFVSIDKIDNSDTAFKFLANDLINGKTTKTKLTAYCDQNTRKASITVTINNPVVNISPTLLATSFSQKNDNITVMFNETTYSDKYKTTMKPTIYIMTEPDLTLDSKFKLQGTKAKEITARLSTDKSSFTLTLKKMPSDVTTDHHVYILYKEGKECKLFYIGYIDKNDLIFKSAYIN